jgi:hypothetical protein
LGFHVEGSPDVHSSSPLALAADAKRQIKIPTAQKSNPRNFRKDTTNLDEFSHPLAHAPLQQEAERRGRDGTAEKNPLHQDSNRRWAGSSSCRPLLTRVVTIEAKRISAPAARNTSTPHDSIENEFHFHTNLA